MANKLSNFTSENCSTIGTGDLILTGPIAVNQTRFRDGLSAGNVYYSAESGANRETGLGKFNGIDRIIRTVVRSTLVNGVYDYVNPTAIFLNGASVVSGTLNAETINSLESSMDNLATDVSSLQSDIAANTGNIASNLVLIETNIEDIGVNSVAIVLNESNIDTNTQDIAALQSGESGQAALIQANTDNIVINVADIATNTGDIATVAADLVILDDDVSYRESAVTALESGGDISQNGNTSILMLAGRGEVINSYDNTEDQITAEVNWPEQTYDLLANAGMPVVTGLGNTAIAIDVNGVIQNFPNGMSNVSRRTHIRIGVVEYIDRVIDEVVFTPTVSNSIGNTFYDYMAYHRDNNLKGSVLRPTEIGDLSMWKDSGTYFRAGMNYSVSKVDPNIILIPPVGAVDSALTFTPVRFNNGTTVVDADTVQVPNTQFEPGGDGGLNNIANNKAVIHYLFQSLGGHFYLSYAQQEYTDYPTALNNLFADQASHAFPAEFENMILLGQIVILVNAITWGPTAEIYPTNSATSAGSGGGSASTALAISYTDTYAIGTNVQVALDSLAAVKMTTTQKESFDAANAPTGTNPVATQADVVSDHTLLSNIGINTHVNIDSHIDNAAIHFNQASISITESQISDLGPYEPEDPNIHAHIVDVTTNPHNVTIDAVSPTSVKGDLLVDNGADVVSIGVGTDGQILTADSGLPNGVKWAASASGGQVNSVVGGTGIAVDATDAANPIVSTPALLNIVEDPTPQLGGDLDCNLKTFDKSCYNQATDASASSGTHTFDFFNGDYQELSINVSASVAIAFAGFIPGKVCTYMIDAVNWGGATVSYPAGLLFDGGIAPTYTAAGLDKLMVVKDKDEVYSLTVMQLDSKAA